ncbi:serine hydrolase [Leptobacterium flavescens]|uniref:Serine hydrolase n=1 Tax=Leptobacterium flavescens TaxID=472055 RepID=A0A6P0UNC2_9FLAO|nr:serine hydrolase domain-containing protein [Leptobacterium flavescens]NER13960.1 serine hydrolase [Leptobacterium flavescens]
MKLSSINFIIAFFCLLQSCGQSPNKEVAHKEPNKLEELNNYIDELEKEGLYGSFLFMENDKILFEKSVGYANREKQIKSSKSTIYPYGSIVKDYTYTVTLLLASEGLFELEDPLGKFYENIPEDKKKITIAQLLQHRSGLLTYHDNIPELRKKYKGIPADLYPGTKEEALGYIFSQKLKFTPGTDQSYSNSGYTLLAYLIEGISGKKFDEVVREKILLPAKTTTADFYQSPLWKSEDVAVGYGRSSYGKENSAYYWPRNPNQLIGNGGMAGTLYDLYKGLKYMMSLEETNKEFSRLSKKYKYIEDLPDDIVGSSGGGNLGNVMVLFGIKSKGQYLLFASNNDDDGSEDVLMLRKVTLLGFDFDIASLAPEEFKKNGGEEESEFTRLDKDSAGSKWDLPKKVKYERIAAFFDLLSNQLDIESFEKQHCSPQFSKKLKKNYEKWPKLKSLKYRIESYGREMELSLKDTINRKQYIFEVKLEGDAQSKFKSIQLKQ